MKTKQFGWANAAAFAALAITTATLRSQDIPLTVNLTLTATAQGPDNGGNPISKIKTSAIKIATKDILNLLAPAAGGLPLGSKLSLSDGSVSVVDKNGNELLPDIAEINVGTQVESGQSNSTTAALSHLISLTFTFSFDDGNGNSFNLTGLAKGTSSLSPMDTNGNQKESISLSAAVVGDGTVGGNDAVFSGTMTASGKGTRQGTQPPPSNPLAQGLIAYYPFNGNANDESGNGNNALVSGAALTSDRFGMMNSAFHFNGAGDNLSSSVGLPLGNFPRSITAWINPDADAAPVNGAIDYGNGDCSGLMFGISFSKLNGGTPGYNNIGFWGGCQDYLPNLIAPSNHWSFAALTYDGSNIGIYVNGLSAKTAIGTLDTQPSHFWIGAETLDDGSSFRGFFKGSIDDVRVYNRALSDSEVQALYSRELQHPGP